MCKSRSCRSALRFESEWTDPPSSPTQSSAADIARLAMVKIYRELQSDRFNGQAMLIHMVCGSVGCEAVQRPPGQALLIDIVWLGDEGRGRMSPTPRHSRIGGGRHDAHTPYSVLVALFTQMHDELLLEVREESLPGVAAMTRRVMEGVMEGQVSLNVPFAVKLSAGRSWGELEEILI